MLLAGLVTAAVVFIGARYRYTRLFKNITGGVYITDAYGAHSPVQSLLEQQLRCCGMELQTLNEAPAVDLLKDAVWTNGLGNGQIIDVVIAGTLRYEGDLIQTWTLQVKFFGPKGKLYGSIVRQMQYCNVDPRPLFAKIIAYELHKVLPSKKTKRERLE